MIPDTNLGLSHAYIHLEKKKKKMKPVPVFTFLAQKNYLEETETNVEV